MVDPKIVEFVSKQLKIANVIIDQIFQDGYQVYYFGDYVGNVQYLYK